MVIGGKLAMAKREDNRFVHVFQCIKDVKAYLGLASLSIDRDQTFCAVGLLRQQLNGHVAEQAFEIDLGKIAQQYVPMVLAKIGQNRHPKLRKFDSFAKELGKPAVLSLRKPTEQPLFLFTGPAGL